jgi:hypothetical protein
VNIVATYDYVDEEGALLFQVCRTADKGFWQRRPDGRGGWINKGSRRLALYRLPQVLAAVAAGEPVYVAEGEKDVEELESAGVVATCNPMGAGKWRAQYGKPLRGATVIVVQDRDEAGREHAAKVIDSLTGIAARVRLVEAAEGKDASDHLAAGYGVDELVSVPLPDNPEKPTTDTESAPLSQKPFRSADLTPPEKPALADEEDILSEFRSDLEKAGLAGEQRGAQLQYLALTSRVLLWGKPTDRPVSAVGKGASSTGKSYLQEMVLRFFPPEAYFDLGSMSKRFLLYSEESLAHRFLVIPEWASIVGDGELVASLRTLLSEGRLIHGTVDGDARRTARRIEKEGPTGLLMTTTNTSVDPELETRCISFFTDDTPDQTARVFETLAGLEDEDDLGVDFDRWHALQRWIAEAGARRVWIPCARALARLMPTVATRLRRDFVSMLCLVRAHALLHQATRERDERGRVVATIADYTAVHELLDELVAEAVEASVSLATRETVEAVRELLEEPVREWTSVKKIADRLGIGRSATYDRVTRATEAGFLVNKTRKDERGWKVALGAELPSGGTFLPAPEEVFRVDSDRATGEEDGSTMRDSGELSAFPAIPADPPEEANEEQERDFEHWRLMVAEDVPADKEQARLTAEADADFTTGMRRQEHDLPERDGWPPPGYWRDPTTGKRWRSTDAEMREANRLLAKHRDVAQGKPTVNETPTE